MVSMGCDLSADLEEDLGLDLVFTEPERPPSPKPTWEVFKRNPDSEINNQNENNTESWSEIRIRLVGAHPLWGQYLWNAARAFASYLDINPRLYRGLHVLELGAGGGLPGIVAAKNGAGHVVLTDYPDADLIRNLEHNVCCNIAEAYKNRVSVLGYIWGRSVQPLLEVLPRASIPGFDLVILSDLIFNHSQHDALLTTCELVLAREACLDVVQNRSPAPPSVLVFYTHHRPKLAHRDMEFFDKARERGWACEKLFEEKYTPMFPDDPGEEDIRSTVHGWRLSLTWRE